jgi:hypothetical protein
MDENTATEPAQRPERVPLADLAEQADDFFRAIGDTTVPVAAFNSSI